MDALSEILRAINLESAIFFNAELSEPWCLAVPDSRVLAHTLTTAEGHVIIHHLLAEGRAYVQLQAGERVALSAGDIITLPHGHAHTLGSGAAVTPIDARANLPAVLEHGPHGLRIFDHPSQIQHFASRETARITHGLRATPRASIQ